MKTIILILFIINAQPIKVPVKINISESCEDAYYKMVIWKDNPNYKPGNYDIWGYYTYNNKPTFGYTCYNKGD